MTAPAEKLRAAAAIIRERAEKATPGPYVAKAVNDDLSALGLLVTEHQVHAGPDGAGWLYIGDRPQDAADAEHIAMWSPGPALAVAALVDAAAAWWESIDLPDPHGLEEKPCADCAVWHAALAVARAIGGQP